MDVDFLSKRMFEIKYKACQFLDPIEPYHYILKYKATVCEISLDDGETSNAIGHYDVWRFSIEAYRKKTGCTIMDIFDSDSGGAFQLYYDLFDEHDVFHDKLDIISDESDILCFWSGNFPADMEHSPLTLAAVERIIENLGGACAVAVINSWGKPMPDVENDGARDVCSYLQAEEARERHWGKIGFRRVPDTPLLVRDLALRVQGWTPS